MSSSESSSTYVSGDWFVGDCLKRASALAERARRLANRDYPNKEPNRLAELIERIAIDIQDKILHYRTRPFYNSDEKHIRNIRNINKLLAIPLSPILDSIESATIDKVPYSLVRPLSKAIGQLQPDAVVMLCPTLQYNYFMDMQNISATLQQVVYKSLPAGEAKKLLANLDKRIYVAYFPALERKSVLLHPVLYHELGHLISERYLTQIRIPQSVINKIIQKATIELPSAAHGPLNVIAEKLELVAEYHKRAVQEIGADIAGIYLGGPAVLLAYYAMASSFPLDVSPEGSPAKYPPWPFRFDCCLHILREMKLTSLPLHKSKTDEHVRNLSMAYASHIEEIVKIAANADKSIGTDPYVRIAYEWLKANTLPKLQAFLLSQLQDHAKQYMDYEFWEHVIQLVMIRYQQFLPPNKLNDIDRNSLPASLSAILTAGWIHYLHWCRHGEMQFKCKDHNDKLDSCDYLANRDIIDRLSLLGIELSLVEERYNIYLNEGKS